MPADHFGAGLVEGWADGLPAQFGPRRTTVMAITHSNGSVSTSRSGGPTILIVEDHVRTREVVRDWLSYIFPAAILQEASTGDEALESVAAQPPDLVLMDVELPGMKGIEATRRIKLLAPAARVVILSIYQAPEYRSAARAVDGLATQIAEVTQGDGDHGE